MSSNSDTQRRLQIALNNKGYRILCNRSQFFSEEQNRPITMYKVCHSVWNPFTDRNQHKELFSSASQIQCVLFLRNLWYMVNGWDIPPTNEMKGAAEFKRKWAEFYESADAEMFKGVSPNGKA